MYITTNLRFARTPAVLTSVLLVLAVACGGESSADDDDVTDGSTSGPDGNSSGPDGSTTGPDGSTGAPDAWVQPANCDSLPSLPITSYNTLDIPGSEDFTFDDEGHMFGVTVAIGIGGTGGNNLVRTTYDEQTTTILPAIGTPVGGGMPITVRGMRFLADGDMVFADRGSSSLIRLDMENFTKTPLISGFSEPNGVVVDMNGFVYMTGGARQVVRVNAETGENTTLYNASETLDGIGFSPDYSTLYFNSERGTVYEMPVYPDGTAGEATVLTQLTSGGFPGEAMLDGLTVDECGNLYVVEMSGTIYRVTPDGDSEVAVEFAGGFEVQLNAVNFGTGVGGWKDDAIYAISMGGDVVYETVLGVRGAPQPHL